MTRLIVFGGFLLIVIATFVAASDLYSDKYDDIDIDQILYNPRQRKQYSMCYLGTGPCPTPAAKFFKETFSNAVATKCRRCTEKQKGIFEKIVVFYMTNEPELWKKILGNILEGKKS